MESFKLKVTISVLLKGRENGTVVVETEDLTTASLLWTHLEQGIAMTTNCLYDLETNKLIKIIQRLY